MKALRRGRVSIPIAAAIVLAAAGMGYASIRLPPGAVDQHARARRSRGADDALWPHRVDDPQRRGMSFASIRLGSTTGVTANVARAQDQHVACQPTACPPVPDDNYRVEQGHRLLTYLMPPTAQVTVLGGTLLPTPTQIFV